MKWYLGHGWRPGRPECCWAGSSRDKSFFPEKGKNLRLSLGLIKELPQGRGLAEMTSGGFRE